MSSKNIFKIKFFITAAFVLSVFSSCKKFVELGPPPASTVQEDVFKTDPTATSAILGLYSAGPILNLVFYYSVAPGMSADDVQYNISDVLYDEFENNSITTLNGLNENNIWFPSYTLIKNANFAISGLEASQTLTPAVKDQLLGEAKFFRAFAYFYLVNLYGDVPLALTDKPIANATLPRAAAADVWAQIIKDLTEAQASLPAAYTGTFKARVNKWAAASLLARVYLYKKDWVNAEAQASQVIGSGTYSLPTPANTFINTSTETILQIANLNGFTILGANYLAATGVIPNFSLYDTIYKSFEAGDLRKTSWSGVTTISNKNYYPVTKYKVRSGTGNEYSIALRLAEQYLIRAEARAQQNNLSGAKADIDVIRVRAGLPVVAALTQAQMLSAIEQERKVELFGEWGHRWLDLKRTNRADAVIGGQKPGKWSAADVLYPIPENQRIANPGLTQNAGY